MNRLKYVHPVPGSQSRVERSSGLPSWLIPIIVGLILVLILIVYLLRPGSTPVAAPMFAGDGPRAQISQSLFDYGDVKNGSTVNTEFTIQNTGNRQLQFRQEPVVQVVEGCCPPQAAIDRMELDPGETATISFSFSMHEGMDGPHEFRVKVLTNDVEQPEQEVIVHSNWVN